MPPSSSILLLGVASLIWRSAALALPLSATHIKHASSLNSTFDDALSGLNRRDIPSILFVGDSITQGHEGDWTWRYRLWQWLRQENVGFNVVGPYDGTRPPDPASPPQPPAIYGSGPVFGPVIANGKYAAGADAAFTGSNACKHFGVWGRMVGEDENIIGPTVKEYQPSLLLVMLGFNDLGWDEDYNVESTLDAMGIFIGSARSGNPNVKIALANVVQRTLLTGRRDNLADKTTAYNRELVTRIATWDQLNSPIRLVDVQSNYQCASAGCPSGYDGLHPNAIGEYQIAQAFAQTLSLDFGIGRPNSFTIPSSIPTRPIAIPSNVRAITSTEGITVTWDPFFGAIGYDVDTRFSAFQDWSSPPWHQSSNRYDLTGYPAGQTWFFRVRTSNGDNVKSDWSPIVSAQTNPVSPSPPTNMKAHPNPDGTVLFSWDPPVHHGTISIYEVIVWDRDTPGAWASESGIVGTHLTWAGMLMDHRYILDVVAWDENGRGVVGSGPYVNVGAGMPPVPHSVMVTTVDATTVTISWCGSEIAAAYIVWTLDLRNKGKGAQKGISYTFDTSTPAIWLFPGVENFAFCVSAMNGDYESGMSACTPALKTVGTSSGGPTNAGANCYRSGGHISPPNPTATVTPPGPTHTVTQSAPSSTGTPAGWCKVGGTVWDATIDNWNALNMRNWLEDESHKLADNGAFLQDFFDHTEPGEDSDMHCIALGDGCTPHTCDVMSGHYHDNYGVYDQDYLSHANLAYRAVNNFYTYWNRLLDPVNQAFTTTGLLSLKLVDDYMDTGSSNSFLKDGLTVTSSLISAGLALVPEAEGVGELVGGLSEVLGAHFAEDQTLETEIKDLSQVQQMVVNIGQSTLNYLHDTYTALVNGRPDGNNNFIWDWLDKGGFVEYDTTTWSYDLVTTFFETTFKAVVVNQIWRSQGVYILRWDQACSDVWKSVLIYSCEPDEQHISTIGVGRGAHPAPKGAAGFGEDFGDNINSVLWSSIQAWLETFKNGQPYDSFDGKNRDAEWAAMIKQPNIFLKAGVSFEGLWTIPVCYVPNAAAGGEQADNVLGHWVFNGATPLNCFGPDGTTDQHQAWENAVQPS